MLRNSLVLGLALLMTTPLGADDDQKGEKKGDKKAKPTSVKVGDVKLSVPARWKKENPTNRLRLAQYKIPAVQGDKDPAELTVFYFGPNSGSVGQNLQRWISQFQTSGRKLSIVEGKSKQGAYYLLDISGTFNRPIGPPIQRRTKPTPGSRMIGVILRIEKKGPYYFKLTGPDKTVVKAGEELRASFGGDKKTEKKQAL